MCVFDELFFIVFVNKLSRVFEHSLLYAYQTGFIRGHSTVYQLLEMYYRVCQNLDERLSTILIFCDISKAFDRVWHEGLIKKLKSYGISGDLLIRVKNYLSGRRQFLASVSRIYWLRDLNVGALTFKPGCVNHHRYESKLLSWKRLK